MRVAIESLYSGFCTISNFQKVTSSTTKRTTTREVMLVEDEPCRLSYKSAQSGSYNGVTTGVKQQIKLFIRPEIVVLAGSKVTVTQNGRTVTYKSSGQPSVYSNHQEILLELDEDKA